MYKNVSDKNLVFGSKFYPHGADIDETKVSDLWIESVRRCIEQGLLVKIGSDEPAAKAVQDAPKPAAPAEAAAEAIVEEAPAAEPATEDEPKSKPRKKK